MSLDSLQDLYIEHIQDLYDAEQQIIKALPKLIDKAANPELKRGFTEHLAQTREHARRLESIGKRAGQKVDGKTCKGMEGVIKEGAEVLKEDGDETVLDAALISAAQRVEHYEMAGYGCARAYAEALGFGEDADALQQTLDEEAETDEKLTQLAESIINPAAADESTDTATSSSRSPRSPARDSSRDRDNEARF
ncbi:MAG TPA: ferritin-like domain-containing protein [Gemmatimonadaceae bacterium]|jgi:ferritin-like metal-binding protein YciE|nr:ferritin-like domain-containing protein [Gemmatimonadaceae bacterium]